VAEILSDRPEFDRIAQLIRGELNDMADENDTSSIRNAGSIRNRTVRLLN